VKPIPHKDILVSTITENDIDFMGSVIFALDLGEERNRNLIDHYKGRNYYYYEYDPLLRKAKIIDYS